ncbi:unnamed protein product [Amoebophrya sp. A25]|nr:unnamed protein product [Amoebophrya sp. A25]|eukprot:GSA25T00014546001.1
MSTVQPYANSFAAPQQGGGFNNGDIHTAGQPQYNYNDAYAGGGSRAMPMQPAQQQQYQAAASYEDQAGGAYAVGGGEQQPLLMVPGGVGGGATKERAERSTKSYRCALLTTNIFFTILSIFFLAFLILFVIFDPALVPLLGVYFESGFLLGAASFVTTFSSYKGGLYALSMIQTVSMMLLWLFLDILCCTRIQRKKLFPMLTKTRFVLIVTWILSGFLLVIFGCSAARMISGVAEPVTPFVLGFPQARALSGWPFNVQIPLLGAGGKNGGEQAFIQMSMIASPAIQMGEMSVDRSTIEGFAGQRLSDEQYTLIQERFGQAVEAMGPERTIETLAAMTRPGAVMPQLPPEVLQHIPSELEFPQAGQPIPQDNPVNRVIQKAGPKGKAIARLAQKAAAKPGGNLVEVGDGQSMDPALTALIPENIQTMFPKLAAGAPPLQLKGGAIVFGRIFMDIIMIVLCVTLGLWIILSYNKLEKLEEGDDGYLQP